VDGERFDRIARTLSGGATRRRALGGLAAVLGGALLPAWAGDAGATTTKTRGKRARRGGVRQQAEGGNRGGNSACAQFCAQVFGEDTPEAGACTSSAAKGRGLCYACGPAATDTALKLCGQVCIAAEDCCDDGTEVARGAACAAADEVCLLQADGSGACAPVGSAGCAGADPCGETGGARTCGVGGACTCYSTTEGAGVCLNRIGSFEFPGAGCAELAQREPCDTSAECGPNAVCAPLNALGARTGSICCANREPNAGKIGFCVDVALEGALCPVAA
jgi:hypothetical protein